MYHEFFWKARSSGTSVFVLKKCCSVEIINGFIVTEIWYLVYMKRYLDNLLYEKLNKNRDRRYLKKNELKSNPF